MAEKTGQVTGTVPVQVERQMKAHALMRGCPVSDLVREAVLEWVDHHPLDREKLLRELGLLEDTHADEIADARNGHGEAG